MVSWCKSHKECKVAAAVIVSERAAVASGASRCEKERGRLQSETEARRDVQRGGERERACERARRPLSRRFGEGGLEQLALPARPDQALPANRGQATTR
ncbi:hypothetical protein KC320_g153 [Hortaea werneckii]|nr:hypothetical protein KC320_g153 [Hortaea werneckii]